MNFFAHQAAARAKTRRMVWLFVLAILVIVAAINVVVLLVFGIAVVPENAEQQQALVPAMLASTAITLAVIGLGSLFKTLSLRSGGGSVARSMGGTLVPGDPRDFQLKRLRNVIEEMSIASGVPVPEIYVLDREPGINAFAAGFGPSDAAIAVTRGALDRLSRDELQGVIAHEYSHILNGDMRLNLRLMGLIFGLLVLGLTGRKVLEHMRIGGSKKEGNAILLIALAVMVFGYLGVFLGRMIKAYISRQREYLADASAVQFTRLSHGLSGALMKIAAFQAGSRLTGDGEEVAHMLFGDGVGYGALTATHPPLVERIKRIDPRFDPQLLAQLAATERSFEGVDEGTDPPAASALLAGFGAARHVAPAPPELEQRVNLPQPQQMLAGVANPGALHVEYAIAIRQSLPPVLTAAAHMRERAIDVVLSLLTAREGDPAGHLAEISQRLGPVRARGTQELIEIARDLHPAQRMPLAALALPALKRRPASEVHLLIDTVDTLIQRDGRVDVFEYGIARLLRQQLTEAMDPARARGGHAKLPAVRREALALLAILAHHGHADSEGARRAFVAGAAVLFPGDAQAYATPRDWIGALDSALPALDALVPAGKETLVLALATTVGFDGQIAIAEAELLRLTCTLLHCPLPPILGA
ncbi:MAG TPA: M48 family metallopeptidase [Xanthomonadales bacterium]|nr:M48 family metallopeptidase [Xanthomonadales bacterium]